MTLKFESSAQATSPRCTHLRSPKSPGRVVAVADCDLVRSRALTDQFGGTPYDDYRLLIAHPQIDVVTLGVPHYLHAPITLEAAAAGKHVLCEKPMAVSAGRMMQ